MSSAMKGSGYSLGMDMILGLVGAVTGGILYGLITAGQVGFLGNVVGAVLGAWYLLLAVKRVFFGRVTLEVNEALSDLNGRELMLVAPFAFLIIVTGVWPGPMIGLVAPDVARIHALLVGGP